MNEKNIYWLCYNAGIMETELYYFFINIYKIAYPHKFEPPFQRLKEEEPYNILSKALEHGIINIEEKKKIGLLIDFTKDMINFMKDKKYCDNKDKYSIKEIKGLIDIFIEIKNRARRDY